MQAGSITFGGSPTTTALNYPFCPMKPSYYPADVPPSVDTYTMVADYSGQAVAYISSAGTLQQVTGLPTQNARYLAEYWPGVGLAFMDGTAFQLFAFSLSDLSAPAVSLAGNGSNGQVWFSTFSITRHAQVHAHSCIPLPSELSK